MTEPPFLRIERLWKRFGAFTALKAIDLEVRRGEFVCFLGPSGCGKTTLLRAIAGLDPQDEGRIEIAGRDVSRAPPAERDFGIVFQSYALFPNLTVARNVGYGLVNRRKGAAEIKRRVDELLALVGLPEQHRKYPAQLSGGQQQRVALARAIVRQPTVYLMDEPLSNLDAQLRLQTRTELKRLHQELGTTMIYVTHDQGEAMTLGSRIAIMRHGDIVQVGTPMDLYRRPVNTFVATFLGSPPMNLIHDARNGSNVTLGIRPEDVEVGTTGGDGWEQVQTLVVEPMGSETLLTLAHRSQRIVARVAGDRQFTPDQPAWIRLPPDRVLTFDASSGTRIEV